MGLQEGPSSSSLSTLSPRGRHMAARHMGCGIWMENQLFQEFSGLG